MADEIEVRIEDLTRIEARLGDRFVYRPPAGEFIDMQRADRIHQVWASYFPDNPLIVMPGGDLFAIGE